MDTSGLHRAVLMVVDETTYMGEQLCGEESHDGAEPFGKYSKLYFPV